MQLCISRYGSEELVHHSQICEDARVENILYDERISVVPGLNL